ncbi:MAG: ABC-type transport system involved in cytochrome c biogenesis, permease component [Candidatus Midichloria mitochondrii]|uniref:Heme exporter protein C n=1 Tax=Midichloria mitochondrii (strain IricVA) TaxID=696127 RepID=F7XV62_MIDMI|nr:heme ABC transporter permease CcmC [Candidatus Midichloria mitochondrii]AEI88561.1 heme exporter protein C [Candidatus Midichloria mitochondrii IricVA]MDJ1583420.1 heme ABC transporter permease CcmC [Candidatus Midichloria mitochondrii]
MKLLNNIIKFFVKSNFLLSFLFFLAAILIITNLFLVFKYFPEDYLQGNLVKIMYTHVPFAWVSMLLYSAIAISSIIFLIKEAALFDILAKSSAYVLLGAIGVTLLTGSIWGKPAWGTWWVWDARLTSILILFFITLSYILVRSTFYNEELGARIAAITAIVGFLNVPIIKFSVDFWGTLHQKSTFFRAGGPSIHPLMMYPNIIMFFGVLILVSVTIISRIKLEIIVKRLNRIEL